MEHAETKIEPKNAESALKESEAKFKSIFDNSPIGTVIVGMDKKFVECNAAFCEFLGYGESELIGREIAEVTYPADLSLGMAEMRQLACGEIDSCKLKKRYVRKDGRIVWGEICISIIRDDGGKPLYYLSVIADITESKIAGDKIEALLTEKNLLLKEVHHRIKNNMNTLSGLLSLQAATLSDPVAVESLENAGGRVRSMQLLYDKLYTTANFHEMSVASYLPGLVDEILANFPNFNKVTVRKNIQDFVLPLKQLQPLGIILNELLTNTMKYAFTGKSDGTIEISATIEGKKVTLSVADDGCGIPDSVSFNHSTGFGLELVHGLTQQISSTIRIERESGTKIILEFDR